MNPEVDDILHRLRSIGAGPCEIEFLRRCVRSLAPPYEEPEVVVAEQERARRAANNLLASTPPDGKGQ